MNKIIKNYYDEDGNKVNSWEKAWSVEFLLYSDSYEEACANKTRLRRAAVSFFAINGGFLSQTNSSYDTPWKSGDKYFSTIQVFKNKPGEFWKELEEA